LLSEINVDNAHLTANIHANLGALYRKTGQMRYTKQYMDKGITETCTGSKKLQYRIFR